MNTDIRINIMFLQHPKTVKLRKRLGDSAIISILSLWCFAAQSRPEGALLGMDIEDIEISAQWDGEAGLFVKTLLEIRLMDLTDGVYLIHDWQENNPWVADFENRSAKGKKAVTARWEREKQRKEAIELDTTSIPLVSASIPVVIPHDELSNTPFLSFPSPSSPLPNKDNKPLSEYSDDFLKFWSAYPVKVGKGKAWLSWKKCKPLLETVLKALEWQIHSKKWKEGFIVNPETYLNQRRWEDEPANEIIPAGFASKGVMGALQRSAELRAMAKGGNA